MKRIFCLALVTGLLASCGGTKQHNAADVTFAQQVVTDEAYGAQIAQLGATHAYSQRVRDTAAAIARAQTTDVATVTKWLNGWKATLPAPSTAALPAELVRSTGPAFDRAFLNTLVHRHQQAIEVASAEAARGQSSDAKKLARQMKTARAAEVGEMQGLLTEVARNN